MIAEYRAAEQEVIDAREAIEVNRVRLKNATENAIVLKKKGQEFNIKVEQLNAYVQNVAESMVGANAELLNRSTPHMEQRIPKYKLEMQFIQLLESIHPDEAKVLLGTKNKTLAKQFAITKDVVKKAFPELF